MEGDNQGNLNSLNCTKARGSIDEDFYITFDNISIFYDQRRMKPKMENAIIMYKEGSIHFNNYETILAEAQELAEHISSVEVTEESVKETKKMLAAVNKKVAELEDGRKQIKREVLSPYEEFEKKVKTITSVIKEADSMVRSQVRELEEQEREAKKEEIISLFAKRAVNYPTLSMLFPFDFIKSQHLNKTYSMNKVEADMVEWFETMKKHIEYISGLVNSYDILAEFIKTQDLFQSITIVEERNKVKESLQTGTGKTVFTITANSNFEATAIETLLIANKINYKRGN